ncbi:aromatic ring-opening dioxygenase LigA [Cellulomonas chengniuliangii]|uniref:Aromatic ring-opening dioxygenase LigA n=1 Tax=Cellulomonas chengniuliangii TaxID=2968084 RepID=A0ABY5KYH6_9CELL|nr:aromatic ring-opening dioxygenase LigA [Cellulomonas chengniuliangii]MCC2309705.1 aromatic ring-opening dioxygenase LigA [Cellulomonas chengniuliangii]MCC2319001.1 aromatic ring-opening dioxygenase LigA [Cellulomonas chengniuliangii]UUI74748.1 aromatic ring-opening dioxygenase LigA [Cellulomonas chengniuliangii]
MSSVVATTDRSKGIRIVGLLTIIAGALLIVAGGVTWGAVSAKLSDERITVSEDAAAFGGQTVNTPWAAFAQADIINEHALAATDGKTYAELGKEDPLRATAMNGSFLRASLFTSVVAFGVAALVMGLGVLFVLTGWAFRAIGSRPAVAADDASPVLTV